MDEPRSGMSKRRGRKLFEFAELAFGFFIGFFSDSVPNWSHRPTELHTKYRVSTTIMDEPGFEMYR